MLIYEIQGKRYPSEPEAETKRKMFANHPPDAEVVVWDEVKRINRWLFEAVGYVEIDRLKLSDLFNA